MAFAEPFKKVGKHYKDVRAEVRKVHWPTRKELYLYSSIVLAMVVVIGVFFWALDTGFTAVLRVLLQ